MKSITQHINEGLGSLKFDTFDDFYQNMMKVTFKEMIKNLKSEGFKISKIQDIKEDFGAYTSQTYFGSFEVNNLFKIEISFDPQRLKSLEFWINFKETFLDHSRYELYRGSYNEKSLSSSNKYLIGLCHHMNNTTKI